jgi:hypothetical protein
MASWKVGDVVEWARSKWTVVSIDRTMAILEKGSIQLFVNIYES